MPPSMQPFMDMGFGSEIIYSFVIIICSLIIYFGTKELYELSSYKGIKYFRLAFLFFAIAYFFRSFIKFILSYFNVSEVLDFSPMIFGPIILFIFIYFSLIAVFYLFYSIVWKKWNGNSNKIYLLHILAVFIAFITLMSRNPLLYLGLNFFLLVFIMYVAYTSYKITKNKTKGINLYAIYLLLSIFWILNIFDILIPNFFQTFRLFIYLLSSGIFLLILYKVIKKTGSS